MVSMLSFVVLAAGEARRMGELIKPLLPLRGMTFLEVIVLNMIDAGAGECLVVTGHAHEEIENSVHLPAARFLVNGEWKSGQLSSLQTALRALPPDSEGMLFTPVDHPLVQLSTYRLLKKRWEEQRERMVIPRYQGRKGHPAIFPRRLFDPLLRGHLEGGARDLIYREMDRLHFVDLDDPGVINDIDTPDDYRRLIGELP
jgi:CTP:molybdopterin cytidylyltransferase MocA